jgi:hypothetical protein
MVTDSGKERKISVPDGVGYLFALTSDYKTGNYSIVGIDSSFSEKNIGPVHSDAVARYFGGSDIYIINRMGRDNMQVVDRGNLKTVLQYKFPPLSNPQDAAIQDGKVYVAFMGRDWIGIYGQENGDSLGAIDLHAYSDSADSLPETFALRLAGGKLYALAQNLDMHQFGLPLTAHLIQIDTASRKAVKSLELPFGNPQGIAYDAEAGKFYIPCIGNYGAADGGIVSVDLEGFAVTDTVATEEALGGDLGSAHLYKGKLILGVGAADAQKVVAVDVADGKAEEIFRTDLYSLGGLAIDAKTATLYAGDRKKGEERLRIFDLDGYKEKSGSKVDLGMPPVDMVVIR